MSKLVLFLAVWVVLCEFVISIEDKAKTCRCDPYSGDRAPWTVSIGLPKLPDIDFPFVNLTGLILNEKWVLASREVNCFFELQIKPHRMRPLAGLEVNLRNRSGWTKNQLKSVHRMMLRDLGEFKNETRYEFFLLELDSPIDFGGHGNSSASFQPGCFLKESRNATEFLYDNLSSTGLFGDRCTLEYPEGRTVKFSGEFTFVDVSNNPNRTDCAKEPEKLICLKYQTGVNMTELIRDWPQEYGPDKDPNRCRFNVSLNTPLYHKVNDKRFIVATLGRDDDFFYRDVYPTFYSWLMKIISYNPWHCVFLFPYHYKTYGEYPQLLPFCENGQKSWNFSSTVEEISFVRVSSILSRIQRYVGDDLCLFERKPDASVGLVPALDHSVDQLQ